VNAEKIPILWRSLPAAMLYAPILARRIEVAAKGRKKKILFQGFPH